ncbi:asparaginase domain-containing protein, partial [Candidatus Aenigmatarchaeota archaeon]
MLSGYSALIQKLMKNKGIGIGQRILVKKGKEHWEGFLMPARNKDYIAIKLDNGYNIGIHFIKGMAITKKKEKRAPKKAEVKIEKHRPDKGKPTIALISTGGTVASRIDYKTGAVTTAFTPEDLYSSVPELKNIANFKIHQIFQMWSQDLEADHWIIL